MRYFMICLLTLLVACSNSAQKEPSQFEIIGSEKLRPIGCEDLRIEIKEYNKKHGTNLKADC